MRVHIELTRCEKPGIIEALVHRDLEGKASIALRPHGVGAHVEVGWTVEMMQRPMRLADRVAHHTLQRADYRVVENTVAGFRNHLGGDGLTQADQSTAGGSSGKTSSDEIPRSGYERWTVP